MIALWLAQTPGGPDDPTGGLGGLGGLPVPTTVPSAAARGELTFPSITWTALLPLIILAVGAILLLTFSSLLRRRLPRGMFAGYTVAVALAAAVACVPLWARVQGWDHILWWNIDTATKGPFSTFGSACTAGPGPACGAIGIDGFSLGVSLVIIGAVILAALIADGYLRRERIDGPELYALLLLAGAGGVLMATANDLIVLFLGLETLSLAVYVLAALHLRRWQSQEAGLKYFVLGGFSSAFFLYGIAMVYGATGSTNLIAIKNLFATTVAAPIPAINITDITLNSPLLLLGIALMVVGLGFKVSAVPFHFWSPDVYEGSPTPVVAFMAAGVKAAGFAALVRVLAVGLSAYATDWRPIIAALAILSMVGGAALAIVQTDVKRILAYSSISHAGFLLMALYNAGPEGMKAILFYLMAYLFMVAGAFGVVTLVSRTGDTRTALTDFKGLGHSNGALAVTFTVFLLGMAGVPFTSGFVAKLYAVIAAVTADAWWLAVIAMLSSVIAAFLYLRIIITMYMTGTAEDGSLPEPTAADKVPVSVGAGVALVVCLFVTVWAGIFPGPLTDFAADGKAVLVDMPGATPVPGAGVGGLGIDPTGVGGGVVPVTPGAPAP